MSFTSTQGGSMANPFGGVLPNPPQVVGKIANLTTITQTGSSIVIPAGQYYVSVKNLGAEGAGQNKSAISNGTRIPVGTEMPLFQTVFDRVTNCQFTSPEITVNTQGATVTVQYY